MQVDNSTANGILNGTVKQQRSRAMDIRFYWMKDRTQLKANSTFSGHLDATI
jgi:hypothetical protein